MPHPEALRACLYRTEAIQYNASAAAAAYTSSMARTTIFLSSNFRPRNCFFHFGNAHGYCVSLKVKHREVTKPQAFVEKF